MKILAFVLMFAPNLIWASPSCLKNVTNEELVDELSYRLGSSSNRGDDYLLSALCSNWTLELMRTDLNTGLEQSIELNLGQSAKCRALATEINSKLGTGPLSHTYIIASCSNWTLHRIAVTATGLSKLPEKNLGTSAKCDAEKDRLNRTW